MTTYNTDAGKTLLTGSIDPEDDPISIRGLGLTAGTVVVVDWVANSGTAVFTINGFRVEVQQDGVITYNNLGVIVGQPQAGASAAIGSLFYTTWDGTLTSAVSEAQLTMTASVVPSVSPPLFSIDENLAQGIDQFTFQYLNATSPSSITLSNIIPAGAVQMKGDGVTLQSGPTPVDYETPTFAVTFDASFTDSTGGPYVTHVSLPVNDIAEGGSTFAFGDLDVVRNVSVTINPPASLTAGSGSYSVNTLPRGLACDPVTGVITGKPFWYQPRLTVILTRGVGTATASMGTTCKTGVAPPDTFAFNFDPAWWSSPTFTSSVSTTATLTTAMKAGLDQSGGTTAAPVLTVIDYTGANISTPFINNDSSAASANQSNAFVVVRGGDKLLRQVRWGYKQGVVRWENWIIPGDVSAASNQYVQYSSNCWHNYYACDFGPFFSGEGFTPLSIAVGPFGVQGGLGFVAERCRMGGWSTGPSFGISGKNGGNTCYLIDVFGAYTGNDFWTGYGSGFVSAWIVGATTWGKRSPNAGLHPDAGQTGAQLANGFTEQVTYDDCVIFMPDARYGSSGLRIQWEGGFTGATHARLKNTIFGISGWEGLIMKGDDFQIDGFMVVPSPGAPCADCQITLNSAGVAPGRATMANTWASVINKNGLWAANPPLTTGQAKTYNVTNASSMQTAFPNISGALLSHLVSPTVLKTTFAVDEPAGVALHPDSVRAYASSQFQPDIGWSASWIKNPTQYGVYDWGTVPTLVAPVITGASVTGATLNFTLDATDGYYFWMADQQSVTPTYEGMIVGTQNDGRYSGIASNTVASFGYGISAAAGAKSVAMTGLTGGQSYKGRVFMLNRLTGALSSITSVTFTA